MTALKSTKLAEEHNFNIHDTEGFDPLLEFQPITTGDVHKIIKSLPSNKAPGCDKLTPKSWKTAHQLSLPL